MAFDPDRFVKAQDPVYARVLEELGQGRKRTHWMWFVFPQLRGLGQSAMSWKFGIESREEAAAYLAHPVLGARLVACAELVNAVEGRSAHDIFGSPDDLKFRACMTLFSAESRASGVFRMALTKYFEGKPDPLTMQRLESSDGA